MSSSFSKCAGRGLNVFLILRSSSVSVCMLSHNLSCVSLVGNVPFVAIGTNSEPIVFCNNVVP